MGMSGAATATRNPVTSKVKRPKMPYLPGLDGIRAVAIMGVLLYHADMPWLPGGFLGVEVFFVVSGYLITVLLLAEHRDTGRVDLRRFWERRARRLLPALAVYLAGSLGLAMLFARDVIEEWREGIWAAVAYAANWFGVFNDISYSEGFERKSFLHHLWSLAVEEQFYLLWPLLLWALLRLFGHRVTWVIIVAGIAASTALMWMLYEPLEDPLRIYYGTDTRAAGLLLGAAGAFIWRPWEWTATHRAARWAIALVATVGGVVGFVGVGWAMTRYDLSLLNADPLFRGGFLVTSALTAAAIAGVTVAWSPIARVAGVAPLRWLGTRSYGIYLWHWPIFQITRERVDVDLAEWPLFVLRVALTFVAAELSYQLVEQPFRHRAVRQRLAGLGSNRRLQGAVLFASLIAVGAVGLLATVQVPEQPEAVVVAAPRLEEATADSNGAPIPTVTPAAKGSSAGQPTPTPLATATLGLVAADEPVVVPDSVPEPAQTEPVSDEAADPPAPDESPERYDVVTFLGDSVMEGAATSIEELIPGAAIDTVVGRHWFEAPELIDELVATATLGDAVVIHLGNNGPINDDLVDDVLGRLADVELVVLVNVRVPLRWEDSVNDHLKAAVERWDNSRLVNWHRRSNDKPKFFANDGVHLTERGRRSYARAMAKALGLDPDGPPESDERSDEATPQVEPPPSEDSGSAQDNEPATDRTPPEPPDK